MIKAASIPMDTISGVARARSLEGHKLNMVNGHL